MRRSTPRSSQWSYGPHGRSPASSRDSERPSEGRTLWRVGYYADPLGFTPLELYQFSHRFDDIYRRFRTLYCANRPT